MASPRGHFNTDDQWNVIKSLIVAVASAVITWLMSDGLDWMQRNEWIAPTAFPLIFAVLETLQRFLTDTRPKELK